jgi:hypothetical protein
MRKLFVLLFVVSLFSCKEEKEKPKQSYTGYRGFGYDIKEAKYGSPEYILYHSRTLGIRVTKRNGYIISCYKRIINIPNKYDSIYYVVDSIKIIDTIYCKAPKEWTKGK